MVVFNSPRYCPCDLTDSAWANGYPPLIAQVCRESRAVAFKSGRFPADPPSPEAPRWWSGTSYLVSWLDPARDRVHLNWTPACEADFSVDGSPLDFLPWQAAQVTSHSGSFMAGWLSISIIGRPLRPAFLEILSRLPKWRVVMRVIVIHADYQTGAQPGLFGLLGDACVKIVDVDNQDQIGAYWKLAEAQRHYDPYEQDLQRESAEYTHLQAARDYNRHIPV